MRVNEQLGFGEQDRLVIINADDLGLSASANAAIIRLLERGRITSASVLAVGDGFDAAMAQVKSKDLQGIGVHLTLTGPFKAAADPEEIPSLVDDKGIFRHDASSVEVHASKEHVRMELRSQILRVLEQGVRPTHLDTHQGTVFGLWHGNDFMEVIYELCCEFGLPFTLPRDVVHAREFTPQQLKQFERFIGMADALDMPLINHMHVLPYRLATGENYSTMKEKLIQVLCRLKPGVSQIVLHPEMEEAECSNGKQPNKRFLEYQMLMDPDLTRVMSKENIVTISWKGIRDSFRLKEK